MVPHRHVDAWKSGRIGLSLVHQSSCWRLQEFRHQGKQMTKEELIQMLRGVGCDENTITAMSNAYDLGFEHAKETLEKKCENQSA